MNSNKKRILTPEEIASVKGLGCLRDKRFDDIFNVRVITRNGKITTAEQRAIAEAADLFGSSEVALSISDGKVTKNSEICNNCGRCLAKCPFGAFDEADVGYKMCNGGRWGKKTAIGRPLDILFETKEQVLNAIERAIILFRDKGIKGERFADTIERLRFDYVQTKILN